MALLKVADLTAARWQNCEARCSCSIAERGPNPALPELFIADLECQNRPAKVIDQLPFWKNRANERYCYQTSFVDEEKRKETMRNIRKAHDRVTPEIQAMSAQFEAYKNSYASILAVLRGDPPPVFGGSQSTSLGSEYGGSAATSSQESHEPSVVD